MNAQLIVSALIRVWSLQQLLGALGMFISFSGQVIQWVRLSTLSSSSQESWWNMFRIMGVQLSFAMISGIVLWIYAPRIGAFILKSLHRPNAGQDAAANA